MESIYWIFFTLSVLGGGICGMGIGRGLFELRNGYPSGLSWVVAILGFAVFILSNVGVANLPS
jgi:hypothetical protein